MQRGVFSILLLFTLCGARQECNDETTCVVEEKNTTDFLGLLQENENLTDDQSSTEGNSEAPITTEVENAPTTPAPTQPTTTSTTSPSVSPDILTSQSTTICWCDRTAGECDINCCCDSECSLTQKQVFTHCSELKTVRDPQQCYSSNFLFRKPSSVKATENNGLFCIVRDNLSVMREFKPRKPIQNVQEFEKQLRGRRGLMYTRHEVSEPKFSPEPYRGDNPVWAVENEELSPLEVPSTVFGDLCLTSAPVYYLRDTTVTCSLRLPRQQLACSQAVSNLLLKFISVKTITSPININETDLRNSLENCYSLDACKSMTLYQCKSMSTSDCKKLEKISEVTQSANCMNFGMAVTLQILHNGTGGIQEVKTYIKLLNNSKVETQVKFLWSNAENTGFVRSGNPGYISGRPVLAGRKIVLASNDTTSKTKEAIELTVNPKGWLTVFDSERGQCSRTTRRSVLFNENVKHFCSFPLEKKYFSKNGCFELQRTILELLLGEDVSNLTSATTNKFLGVYGSSKVEIMADWLQVMFDSYPLYSTQPSFENSSDGLSCKRIFTHLSIDIATAKFGSFINPQTKIVGSLFRLGPPKNVFVRCMAEFCDKSWKRSKVKIVTEVNFLDLTRPAVREFAQPPGLEAKLPHDFFYPFFSGKATNLNTNFCWLLLIVTGLHVF